MPNADSVADELLLLLERSAGSAYYGEPVTQLEHALQCAQLARDAGASDDLVLAALLHDVGHLIEDESAMRHDEVGVINHDEVGAQFLLERGVSKKVAELVGGHVEAKRYLTGTNPEYAAKLSDASATTLALQGGPMNAAEAAAFRGDPLMAEKLRLRSWDEQAKRPGWEVAPLASYRELLVRHLER